MKLPHSFSNMYFTFLFLGHRRHPQHLSTKDLENGGRVIDVIYRESHPNLQQMWGTNILEGYAGGNSLEIAQRWASALTSRIETGEYASKTSS